MFSLIKRPEFEEYVPIKKEYFDPFSIKDQEEEKFENEKEYISLEWENNPDEPWDFEEN